MKQLLTVLVIFSITSLFIACNSNTAESGTNTVTEKEMKPFDLAAAKTAIDASNAEFGNLISKVDSVGLAALYTSDGKFMAFDAENGKVLWEKDLETGIIASPVTYQVGDTQYISIAVGWGGAMGKDTKFTEHINPGTVYTFALNKNSAMPVFPKTTEKKLINIPFTATPQQIQHGSILFIQYCVTCHGSIANGGGNTPDLAHSSEETHKIFKNILLQGLLINKGMPNFSGKLSESDVTDIHNYILATARGLMDKQKIDKINEKSK